MANDKMREEFEIWHGKELAMLVLSANAKAAIGLELNKDALFYVWKASRESLVIDFSPLNVQHASYNNVDCYAISDVGVILRNAGLKVKP